MKKKSTAEYAETAEFFLCKYKKRKSFCGYGFLFGFRPSGDQDKRMHEEEAECAEFKQKKKWNNGTVE